MSQSNPSELLYLLLLLILPVAALAARRVPLGQTLRMALIWLGVFAAGLILATFWVRNQGAVNGFLADAGLGGPVVTGRTLSIPRGDSGHFYVSVAINGVSRRMLIDSGATTTTISRATAAAAGITSDDGFGVMVETANGTAMARRGTVRTIDVGGITAQDFPVLISERDDVDLLGVDFLSSLESWRAEGNRLILEPRPR